MLIYIIFSAIFVFGFSLLCLFIFDGDGFNTTLGEKFFNGNNIDKMLVLLFMFLVSFIPIIRIVMPMVIVLISDY